MNKRKVDAAHLSSNLFNGQVPECVQLGYPMTRTKRPDVRIGRCLIIGTDQQLGAPVLPDQMFDAFAVLAVIRREKERNRQPLTIHQENRKRVERRVATVEVRASSEEDLVWYPIAVQVGAPDLIETSVAYMP